MNFVNGLHYRGIGSCFMQWANKHTDERFVKTELHIPECEKIAVVIGAGYYKESTIIPCSCRRDIYDILKIV